MVIDLSVPSIHFLKASHIFLEKKKKKLCWGFTAQSTQWGHVDHSQFT